MNRALVLNATFEPLHAVPLRRAVSLVLADRAEVVEAGEGWIRSVSVQLRAPLVIRLLRYVKVPRRIEATLTRKAVLARDGHRCAYCGDPADTIDHVLPRSRGGGHAWENCVACCRPCNGRKADRTPAEAGMELRVAPRQPKGASAVVLALGRVERGWGRYLGLPDHEPPAAAVA